MRTAQIKVNGVVSNITLSNEELKVILKEKHLCSEDCTECYANKCQKVHDHKKQNISEYEFITDGLQTFNDEVCESLLVRECLNYVKSDRKNRKNIYDNQIVEPETLHCSNYVRTRK